MSYSGKFIPRYPEKYKGNVKNIVWRSTWEARVMKWLDLSDNVIWWSSEELVIPYYDPIANKKRRYFPDFIVNMRKRDGTKKTYVIEVKPDYQTKQPQRKKRTQKFINEQVTYIINQSKWKAAEEFCKDNGWIFQVLTEKDLGIT